MHSGAYREIFYTAEVSRQPENVSENGHTGKFDRLRTSQNLATKLHLAIEAKRSFKKCVYFKYISS